MSRIRELFAQNLKINRKKRGLSQEKLAEKADVSAHYIAILEIARSFPASDALERIAAALDVEFYELFLDPVSSNNEFVRLREDIKNDMRQLCDEVKQTVDTAVQNALSEKHQEDPR